MKDYFKKENAIHLNFAKSFKLAEIISSLRHFNIVLLSYILAF